MKTHSRLSFGGCDLNRKKRVGKPKSSIDWPISSDHSIWAWTIARRCQVQIEARGERRSRTVFFSRKWVPRRFPGFEGENCSSRKRGDKRKPKEYFTSHTHLFHGRNAARKLINGQAREGSFMVHFHSRLSPVSGVTQSSTPTSAHLSSKKIWKRWNGQTQIYVYLGPPFHFQNLIWTHMICGLWAFLAWEKATASVFPICGRNRWKWRSELIGRISRLDWKRVGDKGIGIPVYTQRYL